jgi:dephospho-CoA kinase
MIIGLTGGIASGKSTASQILQAKGIPVVDADKIAREVVEPGKEAYEKVVAFFGSEILREDKTINRPRLGEIIFNDKEKRSRLNEIVHPSIRAEMKRQAIFYTENGFSLVVLDIPLLFESKLTHMVEQTWLIYADPEVQLKRLIMRDGFSETQAISRINSQMPIDEKRELADVVIENNGSMAELEEKLSILINQLR